MRPMNFDGRVATSLAAIHDQTDATARHFFFTYDVERFEHSIFNPMDVT